MQVFGFPGAFAIAAKIASQCRFENADDPVVVDRMDKLDRWHAARRNGLNAEVPARVFLDPLHLSVQDRIEDGEQRWQTVGQIDVLAAVLVAHTHTDEGSTDEPVELICIISARSKTREERRRYEDG